MALLRPDVRNCCKDTLLQAGADEDISEFYAEAAQLESDATYAICRIRKELQIANENQTDPTVMCKALQSMSQNFAAWKQTLGGLSARLDGMSPIKVDSDLLAKGTELQANCSVITKQVQMKEGDHFKIVDPTHTDELKVLTENGDEGFVPTVSCLLPSPDVNAKAVIERLEIFLLMCWYECDKRAKSSLIRSLFASSSRMWNQWKNRLSKQTKSDERISRRLKRVIALTSNCEGPLDSSRLHQTLSSIEAELSSKKTQECAQLSETVGELDKALLFYEVFRRHGRSFRQCMRDSASGHKPMELIFDWDPSLFKDSNKTYKYFEVRLTTEERTVKEETVIVQTEDLLPEPVDASHVTSANRKDNPTTEQEISSSSVSVTECSSSSVTSNDNERLELNSQSCLTIEDVEEEIVDNVSESEEADLSGNEPECGIGSTDDAAADQDRTSFGGGSTRQSVDAEQVVVASHEETRRFFVKTVVDPRDSSQISMQQAVLAGIIDQSQGLYINPTTGASVSITKAIGDGNIVIEHVATTRTRETTRSIGLMTIRTETDTHEYTISAAMDTATGEKLDPDEAHRRGIIDEQSGSYFNKMSRTWISLDKAIESGLVFVEFERPATEPSSLSEIQTYAVSAVVDQLRRRAVPFMEAVKRGLVDRNTGSYVNNVTGQSIFAGEAIRRGFFKCQKIDDPSLAGSMTSSNRMIVDKIDKVRKNVLRKVRVASAFKEHLQPSH